MAEQNRLVESAVKFLQLPQVRSKSLEQKTEFLKSKGLSDQEVEEALKYAQQQKVTAKTDSLELKPVQNEQLTQQNEAWESAKNLFQKNSTQPKSIVTSGNYGIKTLQNTFSKPEMKHWKEYLAVTVGALGSVYGAYALFKGSGDKKDTKQLDIPKNTESRLRSKKPIGLKLNGTSFNPYSHSITEQLAEATSNTAALKDYIETIGTSVKNLETQVSTHDREFKLLSQQLDELQQSIPQMLESQKSAQHAMVASLHDDLKSLKNLLVRRNTPANSPQITAPQTPPQTQPNSLISSPLANKNK
ncbi:peroxisomal membrane protein pex14 [Basidiobolus ranarum]|uniref:Peroxisomal membrane protein PEX14 n=1 Tax=Basidiobolus ranarum TaxID=34480 RepID=A0ABR2X4C4_9FUNG